MASSDCYDFFGGFDNFIGDTLATYPAKVELLSIKINK